MKRIEKGSVVIVTGASAGVIRALVRALAKQGCRGDATRTRQEG